MPTASRTTAQGTRARAFGVPAALMVLFVALGVLGGLFFTALVTKHYTGSARVLVQATGVDTTSQANTRTPNGTINLDTEAQLVTSSDAFAQAAKTYPAFSRVSRSRLLEHVAVSVPPNTSVLTIDYTASTKRAARDGANALADGYLAARRAAAQAELTAQERSAQSAIDTQSAQLQKLIAQQLTLAVKSASKIYVGEQIGIVKNRLVAENHQLVTYNAISVTPGRLVAAATSPSSPTSPSRLVDVVSGAALGLLLGLLIVWLRNRFRRTIRARNDIAATTDTTCLAVFPLAAISGPASEEPYRRLGLVATAAAPDARRLVFTSPESSPSSGAVATGVATALRRGGRAVALLRVHAAPASTSGPHTRGIEVTAVPSAEAISTRRGESVDLALERIRGDNDLLVVDCPAAAERADAQAVAADADAVVIVVEAGSRARTLRAAVQSLDEVGAPILGVVLLRGRAAATRPGSRTRLATDDTDVGSADPSEPTEDGTHGDGEHKTATDLEPADSNTAGLTTAATAESPSATGQAVSGDRTGGRRAR